MVDENIEQFVQGCYGSSDGPRSDEEVREEQGGAKRGGRAPPCEIERSRREREIAGVPGVAGGVAPFQLVPGKIN